MLERPIECQHVVLLLQRGDNGYLKGSYVCTTCGREVIQKQK